MVDSMKLIAITAEGYISNEVERIITILDGGFDYVHIRKPNYTLEQTRELISSIPSQYLNRLKLHDYFKLTREFDLGGVHLNSRNPNAPLGCGMVSCSAHSVEDIAMAGDDGCEYITLSPIFDSISKVGYKSHFTESELKQIITNSAEVDIIALGGIDEKNIAKVQEMGFAGAAFLGYIFSEMNITELKNRIEKLVKYATIYHTRSR